MTTTKRLTTQFTLAMLRAVYLTARIYLGLVMHFGRIATVLFLLMTALSPAMLTKALLVLAVTVIHYAGLKLLDAGYLRVAAAVAKPAKRVPVKVPLKARPARPATVAKAVRPADLRLISARLASFSHLHA